MRSQAATAAAVVRLWNDNITLNNFYQRDMAGSGGKREGFILQNVNVLLGGAMLSGLVLLVCLVCCCCRFTSARKPPSDSPSSYWLQDNLNSPEDEELTCDREIQHGIYTLDVREPSENAINMWPSPPPPYSTLKLNSSRSKESSASSSSLPTYEVAIQQKSMHL